MISINQSILASLINAKKQLSDDAVNLIRDFIKSQINTSGGFYDRAGEADPYYSVFGYTLCYVFGINIDVKAHKLFLQNWQIKNKVDFVHATSIIRCFYLLEIISYVQKFKTPHKLFANNKLAQNFLTYRVALKIRKQHKNLLLKVTQHKSEDGGFNHMEENANTASVYANFLAFGLFEDLALKKSWSKQIVESCLPLMLENGAFVNHPKSKQGISSTTAAGVILLNSEELEVSGSVNWLESMIGSSGGFFAGQDVPICDVLSTATSLLALNSVNNVEQEINDKAIEFVNLHWHESGGFFGSVADQTPDIEYTFYGLLAIGQMGD